ncbi:MAG: hypothetical protein H5U40_01265, partial [Polyangiaceae bacterium]|nr:hypothetical protein [Polyangiaceae bacterium]
MKTEAPKDRAPAQAAPDLDLRGYAALLLEWKWLVVCSAILFGAAALFYTSRQPRVYQASSTIEYDPYPIRPLGSVVEDVADPLGNYWRTQEFFQTQNQILKSRALAERVVLRLKDDAEFIRLSAGRPFEGMSPEIAAAHLQGRIAVTPIQNTRLVTVSVQDHDPARAQLITNTLVDTYIDKTVEDRHGSTVNARAWLATQLETLRAELNDAELALHEFKKEHNVLSVSLEDQRNLVSQEMQQLNDALTAIRSRRIALQARTDVLRESGRHDDPMQVHAPAASEDAALVALRTRIHEADQARASLAVRYGENHPDMVRATTELETLRRQYREELNRIVHTAAGELTEARSTETGLR